MNATLPRPRPLAPLSTRRRVVLLACGGYALAVLVTLLGGVLRLPEALWASLALLGMVLAFFGAVQLMKPARLGLPEARDRHIDERQWQRLSQAHMGAYRVLAVVFLLGTLYLLIAYPDHLLPLPTDDFGWTLLWFGAVLLIPSLPGAILAWTEPDLEAPEE